MTNTQEDAMARISRRSLSRSAVAAYSCICVALMLLLGLTIWGAYRDLASIRMVLLRSELGRLRSQAERTVGRLERDIETTDAKDLESFDPSMWLEKRWQRFVEEDSNTYAAIVGRDNRIWLHSDATRSDTRLPNSWYERVLSELGDDVVLTNTSAMSTGEAAYDVHLPIYIDGKEVGEYHVGMGVKEVEDKLSQHQRAFLQRRALTVGGVLLIVLLATTSLYYIATHSISLRRTIDYESIERATEVGAMAAGLAHEIRNPLHAIQLNLHTLQRAQQQEQPLDADEMDAIISESIREIDRIEHLMQQLVGFATPERPRDETIDLSFELNRVVDFLDQELLRSNIEVDTRIPPSRVEVHMDHGRLRQVMLNLMQNAQQAMEHGGRLAITLRRHRNRAEITVEDNGSGIPEETRRRIFEPFYSTKENGAGLGLALVKRFVEEADGEVRCRNSASGGTAFQIVLPLASERKT